MKRMRLIGRLMLGSGLLLSAVAVAADFDGTAPFNCTGKAGYTCEPGKACSRVKQQSEATGGLISIDPGNKTVKTPYRTDALPIANSVVNNEQLQLQGTSDKFAWSAVINRHTGKVTITVADRVGAYVIFGQCKVGGGT